MVILLLLLIVINTIIIVSVIVTTVMTLVNIMIKARSGRGTPTACTSPAPGTAGPTWRRWCKHK